jgi:hypothetical protein
MAYMSLVVSAEDVRAFERLKAISQIAPIKERIKFFEKKYGCDLETFSSMINQEERPESFEEWDDLIEWRAYKESQRELEALIKRIDDATNIRVAQ